MESDPIPWLSYRMMADLVLWVVVLALLLLYLWALTAGPVSALDPAPATAPVPALKPLQTPEGGTPLA